MRLRTIDAAFPNSGHSSRSLRRRLGRPQARINEALRSNPHNRVILEQLLEARRSAEILELDVWTFAVEMFSLLAGGCTVTQLRLLVCAGYLEHAEDITTRSHRARSFRPQNQMTFRLRSCFVLTEAGVKSLDGANSRSGRRDRNQHKGDANVNGMMEEREKPSWDGKTREFKV